jgi:hypothetical protein
MAKHIIFRGMVLLAVSIMCPFLLPLHAATWKIFYNKDKKEIVAIKYEDKTFFYRAIKNKLIDIHNLDEEIVASWHVTKEQLRQKLLQAWLFFTNINNQKSFFDAKADCYAKIITKMLKDDYRLIDCEAEWYGIPLGNINKKCRVDLKKYQQPLMPIRLNTDSDVD